MESDADLGIGQIGIAARRRRELVNQFGWRQHLHDRQTGVAVSVTGKDPFVGIDPGVEHGGVVAGAAKVGLAPGRGQLRVRLAGGFVTVLV